MKRIWIAGSAGSGKTTLSNLLGKKFNIPVYHRDLVTWDENDNIRSEEEQVLMLKEITKKETWIFDGARFTASRVDGRLDRCDTIIYMNLNRFLCLYRGLKRAYLHSKDTTIQKEEKQPFRFEHIKGVLIDYPKKSKQRLNIFCEAQQRGINVIILNSRNEVASFCNKIINSNSTE